MTAVHLHLMVVHLPIVLCPLSFLLMFWAGWRGRDDQLRLAYGLLVAAAVLAAVAFVSGPWAFEAAQSRFEPDRALVEDHAVVARAAFVVILLFGVMAIQALLQFAQEEPPARWLRRTLAAGTLVCCYLLAWSAHLGGQISHPEVRQPPSLIFPRLS